MFSLPSIIKYITGLDQRFLINNFSPTHDSFEKKEAEEKEANEKPEEPSSPIQNALIQRNCKPLFTKRETTIEKLFNALGGKGEGIFLISGKSGVGKSVLMNQLSMQISQLIPQKPEEGPMLIINYEPPSSEDGIFSNIRNVLYYGTLPAPLQNFDNTIQSALASANKVVILIDEMQRVFLDPKRNDIDLRHIDFFKKYNNQLANHNLLIIGSSATDTFIKEFNKHYQNDSSGGTRRFHYTQLPPFTEPEMIDSLLNQAKKEKLNIGQEEIKYLLQFSGLLSPETCGTYPAQGVTVFAYLKAYFKQHNSLTFSQKITKDMIWDFIRHVNVHAENFKLLLNKVNSCFLSIPSQQQTFQKFQDLSQVLQTNRNYALVLVQSQANTPICKALSHLNTEEKFVFISLQSVLANQEPSFVDQFINKLGTLMNEGKTIVLGDCNQYTPSLLPKNSVCSKESSSGFIDNVCENVCDYASSMFGSTTNSRPNSYNTADIATDKILSFLQKQIQSGQKAIVIAPPELSFSKTQFRVIEAPVFSLEDVVNSVGRPETEHVLSFSSIEKVVIALCLLGHTNWDLSYKAVNAIQSAEGENVEEENVEEEIDLVEIIQNVTQVPISRDEILAILDKLSQLPTEISSQKYNLALDLFKEKSSIETTIANQDILRIQTQDSIYQEQLISAIIQQYPQAIDFLSLSKHFPSFAVQRFILKKMADIYGTNHPILISKQDLLDAGEELRTFLQEYQFPLICFELSSHRKKEESPASLLDPILSNPLVKMATSFVSNQIPILDQIDSNPSATSSWIDDKSELFNELPSEEIFDKLLHSLLDTNKATELYSIYSLLHQRNPSLFSLEKLQKNIKVDSGFLDKAGFFFNKYSTQTQLSLQDFAYALNPKSVSSLYLVKKAAYKVASYALTFLSTPFVWIGNILSGRSMQILSSGASLYFLFSKYMR